MPSTTCGRRPSGRGEFETTGYKIRADGTERRWYQAVSAQEPDARIETVRLAAPGRAVGRHAKVRAEHPSITDPLGAGDEPAPLRGDGPSPQ
jgi:hypothetical protein